MIYLAFGNNAHAARNRAETIASLEQALNRANSEVSLLTAMKNKAVENSNNLADKVIAAEAREHDAQEAFDQVNDELRLMQDAHTAAMALLAKREATIKSLEQAVALTNAQNDENDQTDPYEVTEGTAA